MSNKEIKKAKEILEEISQDEREIYLAELREKYILDQKAVEGAGYDKGLKAGIEIGKKNERLRTLQIAKKLLAQNVDIETISKAIGLTVKV